MTINEIAQMAGVSSAAVSRYLNQGSLSSEKKERIRKIIEETNYRPSEYARAMRTKKSHRVGVIVPKLDSESVPKVLSGIGDVMDNANYNVMLMNSNQSMEKEIKLLEAFRHSQLDGLILIASVITEKHRIAFAKMTFPVIIIGQYTSEYSCVYHNDFEAAYEMMRYLLKSGSRLPAYLGVGQEDKAAGDRRQQGVKKALNESGFLFERIPSERVGFSAAEGYEGMERLLSRNAEIDSVFCATDMIAVGAISCLREHNVRVPQDVRVSGIGHGKIADIVTPRLTTVHYRYEESGMEAAKILLELIEDPNSGRRERIMDYQLKLQGTA